MLGSLNMVTGEGEVKGNLLVSEISMRSGGGCVIITGDTNFINNSVGELQQSVLHIKDEFMEISGAGLELNGSCGEGLVQLTLER
jgi:formylmethanofuran dehydrogenase subunit C